MLIEKKLPPLSVPQRGDRKPGRRKKTETKRFINQIAFANFGVEQQIKSNQIRSECQALEHIRAHGPTPS